MQPIIVSKEDYDKGNYPKNTPIMVGMEVGLSGKSTMTPGRKVEPTKITIRLKAA